jgi:hypothetical protein
MELIKKIKEKIERERIHNLFLREANGINEEREI